MLYQKLSLVKVENFFDKNSFFQNYQLHVFFISKWIFQVRVDLLSKILEKHNFRVVFAYVFAKQNIPKITKNRILGNIVLVLVVK